MNDLNDRIDERWKQRRKKSHNWGKLIIMVIILVAIIYSMGILQKMGNVADQPAAEFRDSTAVQTEELAP